MMNHLLKLTIFSALALNLPAAFALGNSLPKREAKLLQGTWILSPEESTFAPDRTPQALRVHFSLPARHTLAWKSDVVLAHGESLHTAWSGPLDGAWRAEYGRSQTLDSYRWEGRKLVHETCEDSAARERDVAEFREDGNVMVIHQTRSSAAGVTYATWVLRKAL